MSRSTAATNGQVNAHWGEAYARQGYGAAGCSDIYYDWRLQDLLRNRLQSAVKPMLWDLKFSEAVSSSIP